MTDLIISGKCSGCGKPAIHGICKKCMDKNKIQALEDQLAAANERINELHKMVCKPYKVNINRLELNRVIEYASLVPDTIITLRFHDQAIGTAIGVGTPLKCWEDDTLFTDVTDTDSW